MIRSTLPILLSAVLPLMAQTSRVTDRALRHATHSSDDGTYEKGVSALDAGRWDDALRDFTDAAVKKGSRADGALYWKAYAENRIGRRDDALASIAALRKEYATSAWLNDAQALEQEIRQQAGRPVSPDAEPNEDLKLMAINGLLHSDPDRAIPLLEKLIRGANSPRVKERALFVLTQSKSPRARQLLTEIAKGGNPDLQVKAIRYMGIGGRDGNHGELTAIYNSSSDLNVKRAILRSYLTANAREPLLDAAKSEKSPELRIEAIRMLGAMGGSSDALLPLYASDSDAKVRKEIVRGLFVQNNAKALVELARKETNPEMKREIVRQLSMMHSKDATDYMMELLNK